MQIIFLTKAFQIFTLSTKLSFLHNGHFGANVSAKNFGPIVKIVALNEILFYYVHLNEIALVDWISFVASLLLSQNIYQNPWTVLVVD